MVIGSGLGGQIGFADESTYGTYATPARFLEFNSESLKADVVHVESRGIGTGRWLKSGRHKEYSKGANGSIELDVMTKGFGLLFEHMLGSYANTVVAGAERRGRSTPDANGKAGQSLTIQVGRPDVGGTSRPFNYEGCKIVGWEFAAALDDPLRLTIDIDAENEQTTSALETASYPSAAEIFVMSEGALTLAGSSISVKSFRIRSEEGLDTDRRFIGNTKKEPLAAGPATISGVLDFEFEALTRHGQWKAGTEVANLIATFTSPTTIAGGGGAGPYKIVITIPLIRFTDGGPNVGGPEILQESLGFEALNDGSNPVCTIDLHSTDTAA